METLRKEGVSTDDLEQKVGELEEEIKIVKGKG